MVPCVKQFTLVVCDSIRTGWSQSQLLINGFNADIFFRRYHRHRGIGILRQCQLVLRNILASTGSIRFELPPAVIAT